tara:strand:+ start:2137 stop:2847 length:711 start_codon:yes stop_codon:yes gene_type:complete
MKFFIVIILLLQLLSHLNAESVPLEDGSFDDQTYGKDGVVLFYDYESEDILANYLIVAEQFEEDENINFWHINCDHANIFCNGRPKVQDSGVPSMLYSFRNELWEVQNCQTYTEHAFQVFFKTKLQENCLNTPSLCSSMMNSTLKEVRDKNHTEIKKLYTEEKKVGDALEAEWEEISRSIQQQWNEKRTGFVLDLKTSDEKLKVYALLMEKLHSESYEEHEGSVQQIVVDMRKKYA